MVRVPAAIVLVAALVLLPLPAASGADDVLESGRKLYSQHDEELIIRHFFQDRRDGFFVDVGCAWPVRTSNTYYLEKHLGWSGIGIDALPDYGPMWARKRPRSRFFNFIVTDHSDTVEPFYRAGWAGVSSIEKDRVMGDRKVKQTEMRIPTITLNDLLEREDVSEIDFLSIDIEGAGLLALGGFDIERYRPELVCIEATRKNRPALLDYFESHGYERIQEYLPRDTVNWYFRPAKQKEQGAE